MKNLHEILHSEVDNAKVVGNLGLVANTLKVGTWVQQCISIVEDEEDSLGYTT
jgi:hypothetical protein